MAKQPFFPNDFPGQIIWLGTFSANIGAYATKYGLSAGTLSGIEADKEWMNYWFEGHLVTQTFSQSMTAFKNEVAYGVAAGSEPSVAPAPPDFGVAPTPVEPGVFPRMLAIANAIKAHKDYTVADGEALGIEGGEITPPDLSTARPVLKPKVAADHVDVGWAKQGLPVQAVELWVKRGAAASAFLAVDTTTPKYVDTQPFPATEEKWTYKGIYILDGGRVGQWSEEVTVTVKA